MNYKDLEPYYIVSTSKLSMEEQIKAIQRILANNHNYPEVVKPIAKSNYDLPYNPKK